MKIEQTEHIENIDFEKQNGLVPAIIQDAETQQVLMLGYMDPESLDKTLNTGLVWFYSRSKNRLWQKGETSGNILRVHEIHADCDQDTILIIAHPKGPTCHTGSQSCFQTEEKSIQFFQSLDQIIQNRKANPSSGSYTSKLFEKGIDRIAQKVGEEATETIIAALNQSEEEFLNEAADLIYHLNVLIAQKGKRLQDVEKILRERHKKSN